MSNHALVHTRFWRAMSERFGPRWIDANGGTPSRAWTELIDRYTPDELRAAIDLLKDRADSQVAHPPTHPEFEKLLVKASAIAKRSDATDYVRGYWRSVIVATILRHAGLLHILPWGTTDLQALRVASSAAYLAAVRTGADLLDWACVAERNQGQRTPGLEQRINTQLWDVLKIWRRDPDAPSQLALTPDPTPQELPACSA